MASQTVFDYAVRTLEPEGGWQSIFGSPILQGSGDPNMVYLFAMGTAAVIVLLLAFLAKRGYDAPKREAMLPDEGLSARNFFDAVLGTTFDLMADLMGREHAKKYFPLIGTLSIFILICNVLGLVPGFIPPTQNLNMSIGMSVSVFIYYNAVGISQHGAHYLEEFTGPELGMNVLISFGMSALLFVIELIGHLARPLSLAVRISGNMTADHQVLFAFGKVGDLVFTSILSPVFGPETVEAMSIPLLLPIPFLFLGLLISIIQTLVFALLSAIYIALAVEEPH
jgi:F-type H+-transporting ATPase subunit a